MIFVEKGRFRFLTDYAAYVLENGHIPGVLSGESGEEFARPPRARGGWRRRKREQLEAWVAREFGICPTPEPPYVWHDPDSGERVRFVLLDPSNVWRYVHKEKFLKTIEEKAKQDFWRFFRKKVESAAPAWRSGVHRIAVGVRARLDDGQEVVLPYPFFDLVCAVERRMALPRAAAVVALVACLEEAEKRG